MSFAQITCKRSLKLLKVIVSLICWTTSCFAIRAPE